MQRQFLLAIILSAAVLFGWQALFPPPPPSKPAQTSTPQKVTTAPSGTAAPSVQPQAISAPVEADVNTPLVSAASDQEVVVETKTLKAVFSARGAALKSWRLKNYQDGVAEPLELIPQNLPGAVRPFTLEVDDAAVSARLKDALFKPDRDAVDVQSSASTLVFEYRDSGGLVARKEFGFDPAQPYVVQFTSTVTQNGNVLQPTILWGPALGTGVVYGGMTYAPSPQPIFYRDGSVSRIAIGDIETHRREQGAFGFAGVDDHYFLSAVVPSLGAAQPASAPFDLRFDPVLVTAQGTTPALQFISWSVKPAAPGERSYFYFGPKDLGVLQGVNRDLFRAIHFGYFDWLVIPLLRSLNWVNSYVHNYGWSIVALTVIINLVMFPLRHKSAVSMRKMQVLQPEMKAIQDRYAKMKMTDPGRQKMNEEVMALYRQHGANPAAGCVPMLLTLPVLIAFYSMLSVAIELRGAPFIGWIKDLSAHDPWFVTPALMGLTQFVQTKMTPMSADPVQQKMMMFMPLMFAGMLLWAPSGLVLYWTVSNIWTVGQQMITNRMLGPMTHNTRPPAERQLKTAGSGRSPQAAKERK